MLVDDRRDGCLALLPLVPPDWLGQGVEVHDAPTAAGLLSSAVRWHGARPVDLHGPRQARNLHQVLRVDAEGFRDLHAGFTQVGAVVFGLSAQSIAYQSELAVRLGLPFEIVSDEAFALQRALALPTFTTGGVTYLKRLTLAVRDGRIERVYYPIAAPGAHAREVCAWLGMIHRTL